MKKGDGRKIVWADSPSFFGGNIMCTMPIFVISLSLNFGVSFEYRSLQLITADV
jgi:hypothetical protein